MSHVRQALPKSGYAPVISSPQIPAVGRDDLTRGDPNMLDRSFTFSTVLAALLWPFAFLLGVLDYLWRTELEALAGVTAALAAVLTIKAHVSQDAKAASTAFRLGQESARLRPMKD